jgi:1,4-dihydroxy-2-naphthoate octaprenyltransferase
MRLWRKWLIAARPKTLTAAAVPCFLGLALTLKQGFAIKWDLAILCLWVSLLIQIATNFINDAADFEKGADQRRVGPLRVTQAGLLTARQVYFGALVCFAMATLSAVPLVISGGWPIVVIGLVSIISGWAYTAGPFPLAYYGLGDLFVILFFGIIAVTGFTFLQTSLWSPEAVLIGLQAGLLSSVLIAINNLRDRENDEKVGKRTLAVRLGVSGARLQIAIYILVPFFAQIFWLQKGWILAGLIPFLLLPLATRLIRQIYLNAPGEVYNRFLGQAAGLHLTFGLLLTLGLFA